MHLDDRMLDALAAAAAAQPDVPEFQVEFADHLALSGRKAEAAAAYRRAVAARPAELSWRCNLAALLGDLGRHEEAVQESEIALAQHADCSAALYNQATSLLALGRARTAADLLSRCARLTPDDPRVHNNLGLAMAADRQYQAALDSYDWALRLKPDYWRALNNRAAAHMALRRFELALADLDRAIALAPRYTQALLNRGAALRTLGRSEGALASFRAAFPDLEALENATDLLMRELHRGAEALACARELYRLAPDRDGAAGAYHAVCQAMADWSDYDSRVAANIAGVQAGRRPASPFRFLYVTDSPCEQLACARSAAAAIPAQLPLWRGEIYRRPRIRIAYLSSDFYAHATAYLAAGLFEHHDRERFECFALAYGKCPPDDPMRARVQAAFEHFEDVDALSEGDTAQRVRSLEIDVLVDLKGYTGGSRLAALSYRAAPVQVHFLGYPGTLGTPFVDYLIADRHVVPIEDAGYYTEAIARMPHTYQVTDDRRAVDESPWTRERAGLPATGLVLAGLHQTYKLAPPVFDVWMRLLKQLPGSSLWLLDREPAVRRQIAAEAAARGVDPARLYFAPQAPQAEHLARLRLADLLLDTWPYSAHTTASDALWAGLPVVAIRGGGFAARVSSSILHAAGLPDLVTNSLAEYEALILALCSEPGRLRALRRRIAASVPSSPLFDTAGFARAIEDCYAQMSERRRAGMPPAPIEALSAGERRS
ncbi:MAG: tetratricopeptide repeat protein [Steroidobacteraceae bacterium]